jgi:hypothetical protein
MHVRYGPGDWLAGRQEWDTTQEIYYRGLFPLPTFFLNLKDSVQMKNGIGKLAIVGSRIICLRRPLLPSVGPAAALQGPCGSPAPPQGGWVGQSSCGSAAHA